jgi:hypothetical protein
MLSRMVVLRARAAPEAGAGWWWAGVERRCRLMEAGENREREVCRPRDFTDPSSRSVAVGREEPTFERRPRRRRDKGISTPATIRVFRSRDGPAVRRAAVPLPPVVLSIGISVPTSRFGEGVTGLTFSLPQNIAGRTTTLPADANVSAYRNSRCRR